MEYTTSIKSEKIIYSFQYKRVYYGEVPLSSKLEVTIVQSVRLDDWDDLTINDDDKRMIKMWGYMFRLLKPNEIYEDKSEFCYMTIFNIERYTDLEKESAPYFIEAIRAYNLERLLDLT